jgi:hypothetical protein
MSTKVKRGLGLLVLAVLAWVIQQALVEHSPPAALEALLLTVAAGCLVVGLGLLAWGLLSGVED